MKREENPAWWRDPLVRDALATGALVACGCILLFAAFVSPLL